MHWYFAALSLHPFWFWTVISIFALVVGSFLNVVMLRVPRAMSTEWHASATSYLADNPTPPAGPTSLFWPPSSCPHCEHRVPARYNIPILGYLILRGRCSHCRGVISRQYPVVEALGVAPVLIVGLIYGISAQSLALISASWVLIASAGIDYQVGILPDRAAYIVLWGGLLASMGYRQGFALIPLTHAVLGVVLGYGLLWCISRGYYALTRVHGMGEGDLKYLAAMGAWVGWEGIPGLLLLGALAGIVAIALRSALCGRKPTEALHFGPALCAGWFATVALHPMPNVLVLGHLLSWSI